MYVYVCMCVCMYVCVCMNVCVMCVHMSCILQWYTQDFNSSNKSSIVILLLVPRARNVLPFVPWRSIVVAKAILDHDKM